MNYQYLPKNNENKFLLSLNLLIKYHNYSILYYIKFNFNCFPSLINIKF